MISLIKKLRIILPPSDKGKLIILFFLMLLAAVLEIIGLGLILMFVSILSDPSKLLNIEWLRPIFDYFGIDNSQDMLIYGSIALISLFILKNTYLLIFNFIQAQFAYNRFKHISTKLFKSYMNAPYMFHLQKNTALLIRNVTQESNLLVHYILLPLLTIVMEAVMVICVVIFLLIFEPFITLIVLLLLGVTGHLLLKLLKHRIKAYGAQALQHRGEMIKKVNEGLGGFKEVVIKNRQNWFIKQFASSAQAFAKAETFNRTADKSSKPVMETVAVAGMLLVAAILVWQGKGINSVIPVLTLFGAASFKLLPSFDKIVSNYNSLRYHGHVINPVYDDLIKLKKALVIESKANQAPPLHLKNKIELENISFTYNGTIKKVINNLSLTVKKGSAIGFIGPTGGGKTTLVDLILGLLVPDEGSIKIDGKDIYKNLSSWQENIGYIPQFIYLSDSTIRNNIAFGLDEKEIDEKALLSAVQMAQLEELIDKLPDGLNTLVGERGVRLSGGQRQRIGIARALYNNPEVLIMDEATSSLDNQTEKYVIEAIERLKNDRTIIMIAHRLTTVKNCDKLFMIRDGKILEKDFINTSDSSESD